MPSVRFSVRERQRLKVGEMVKLARVGDRQESAEFTEDHLKLIARYVERTGTPAFTLGHESVRLGHHVGLLRLGPLQLEIWPKLVEHDDADDPQVWRELLLGMLHEVWDVRLLTAGQAPLNRWRGDLFDLLVARFLDRTEALLREGLARSYREIEENSPVFRGRLLVPQQVRHNAAHAERSYVAYEILDADNLHNRELRSAVEVVRRLGSTATLTCRAEELALAFPEVTLRPIRPAELASLRLDRRTARYREALELARLILGATRPDLRWGDGEVLSLLFDMDHLFEAWVAVQLRRVPGLHVATQHHYRFWSSGAGEVRLRPDIVVQQGESGPKIVIDTKWSVPKDDRPSVEYLRQIFAYLHRVPAQRGVLLYPRAHARQCAVDGDYVESGDRRCAVRFLDLFSPSGSVPSKEASVAGVWSVIYAEAP